MLIAEQKKSHNIAEYILYMYQVEDMLRACQFDWEKIKKQVVEPQTPNPSLLSDAEKWFATINKEMKNRSLEKKGHIHEVKEIMGEIVYLHTTLLDVVKDKKYTDLFEAAKENIEAFRNKSDLGNIHPVEICFEALYMKLLMRLKKQEITAESEQAFDTMRILLAYLSKAYHQMKSGNMDFLNN